MSRLKPLLRGVVCLMLFGTLGCQGESAKDNDNEEDTDWVAEDDQDTGSDSDADSDADGDIGPSPVTNFPGAGTGVAGDPLEPGVSPDTADECGSGSPSAGSTPTVIEQSTDCYFGEDDPDTPAAAIEQIVEIVDNVTYIHIRLTLDPRFVDNSFGENAIGWEDSKKGEHKFKDLVGSDHAEMMLYDKDGNLVLHFKLDYLSEVEDGSSPSGYGSLGVSEKDGDMIEGDESAILGYATSMDRNLNGCGFDEYVEDSPVTDAQYTPDPLAPEWDYRVVYEVWVDASVFGEVGFGEVVIDHVHASPSKGEDNTVIVTPGECPPCDPNEEECDPWGIGLV